MIGYYAQALIRATFGKSAEETERVVSCLCDMLRARSEYSLLPAILEEVKKHIERESAHTEVSVVSQEDVATLAKDIDTAFLALGAGDEKRRITIDPTLIRGFVARARGTQIDKSAKRTLLAMYQSLLAPVS